MTAKETKGNKLAKILLKAADLMKKADGCHIYIVGQDAANSDVILISEVWTSKEAHDMSLSLDGVRDLIEQAIPLLAQPPTGGIEFNVLGGVGLNN